MRSKLTIILILTWAWLAGCSTAPEVQSKESLATSVHRTANKPSKDGETTEANGGVTSPVDSNRVVDADGVTVESTADIAEPKPQTGMNIQPGFDRVFQNGPTAEEKERYTRKPSRPNYEYDTEGDNGAPVYDANTEELIL